MRPRVTSSFQCVFMNITMQAGESLSLGSTLFCQFFSSSQCSSFCPQTLCRTECFSRATRAV